MKISFFIGKMVRGGAERVISLLANHYVDNEYEVDLVLLLGSEINYKQFPLSSRIHIVDLSSKRDSYFLNSINWLLSIREYLMQGGIDCVISFIGRINALVLTSSIGLDIPIIVSERNDPRNDGRGFLMLKYCNFIYRRASKIVFQSKHEQSCFSASLAPRSIIIPNPVLAHQPEDAQIDDYLVTTAGRLNEQKNHKMLIDAVEIAKRTIPEIHCIIYGEGPERENLEEYIKKRKIEDFISLPGNKENIYEYIAKSKFFVMTSNFEGMSNSLLEALMLGKVCITTDYPGADEVITHGYNGLIVPRNDPQILADTLINIMNDSAYCDSLKDRALITSEKYKYTTIMSVWDGVISELLCK